MNDRRQTTRHNFEVHVDLHARDKRIPLRALDVSRHGLFVQMKEPPPLHHAVLMTVRLPGGPFETMATVTRHVSAGDVAGDLRSGVVQQGMGVKLFCLGVDAKDRWDRFVSSLEKPGVELPVRVSPQRGACFLVQPDDPQDLLLFFLRNVVGASIFYLSPAVREIGAHVSVVLVHPTTQAEHVLTASVAEWNADRPFRMGIRFHHVDRDARRAFKEFLGAVPGASTLSASSAEGPPALSAVSSTDRPHWTEYAYYSPKLRGQTAPPAPSATTARRLDTGPVPAPGSPEEVLLLDEEVLDVIQGQMLDLPELDTIDKRELFDFTWKNDGAPEE